MRNCTARDLSIRLGRVGAAAGTTYTSYVFTNKGKTVCQLYGFPVVSFRDPSGEAVPVPVGNYPVMPYPVAVLTGIPEGDDRTPAVSGQAVLTLTMRSGPCVLHRVSRMLIDLPSLGGQLTLALEMVPQSWPGCEPLRLGVQGFAEAAPRPPDPPPPPDFSVQLVLPESVHVGETLQYRVILTNVSGHPIRFARCPGYWESLKLASLRQRYVLNCGPVGPLESGQQVTFAMEFPITSAQYTSARAGGEVDYIAWGLDWPYSSRYGVGRVKILDPQTGSA